MASLLICEMAAYYKQQGKTLLDVLNNLYREHGYYVEAQESRTLRGIEGMKQIQSIMNDWRVHPPREVNGTPIVELRDYEKQMALHVDSGNETTIALPRENVLQYRFADGSWFCIRPSGTEPKLKVYVSVKGTSQEEACARLEAIKEYVMKRIDQKSEAYSLA
jgi:phosphoglucomutase